MAKAKSTRILLRRHIEERVPYSITHVYRLMARGQFPQQIRFGANRIGWLESEVEAWLAAKISAREFMQGHH